MNKYSIAIPTYQRPEALVSCLHGVATLDPEGIKAVLILVTGEKEKSISQYGEWFISVMSKMGFDVRVTHNFAGLPQAKNYALNVCDNEGVDWLLLLDDDVLISQGYITKLAVHIESRDWGQVEPWAVTGVVYTPFNAGYSEWSPDRSERNIQNGVYQMLGVDDTGKVNWGDKVQVYRYSQPQYCCLGYFIGGAVMLKAKGNPYRFDTFFQNVVYGEEIDYSLGLGWDARAIHFVTDAECLHFPCPFGGSKPSTVEELKIKRQANFDYLLKKWGMGNGNAASSFEARSAEEAMKLS